MKNKTRKNQTTLRWLVPIIILGAIITGFVLFFQPSKLEALASDYFEPYENVITNYGSENAQELAAKGFAAYERKEFEQAEVYFTALKNSTNTNYALFYLANTKLALGKSDEAIRLLLNYMSIGEDLSSQSQWYLAMAYLQKDQKEEALAELNRIVKFEGYHTAEAQAVLDKLK